MARLIDQFVDAMQEWARRTGNPDNGWAAEILLWTGGVWRYKPVGAIDPETVPKERRDALSYGDVHGHLTLDQVRADLEDLVEHTRMDEEFLIVSLVHALERNMEVLSEEYAKGIRNIRAQVEGMEAVLNDPAQLEDWLRRSNELLGEGQEPATEGSLLAFIEHMRRLAAPSLQDQRERRVALDVWHSVSVPILEPRNLRRFRRQLNERWGLPSGPEDEDAD
jgi:hypothetical protein